MKKKLLICLVVVLTFPSFFRMLRPGIYSMQDPHVFRMFEFDRCIKDLQIPCRWAPDSGFGYGEPLFNFYTQIPFAFGEIFHLAGLQIIDSVKFLFALSLVGSALSMFFLALKVWGNKYSAFISSVLYVYAPYRAVDVWVRAALPEALAFVLFPIVAYFAYDFVLFKKRKSLIWFSVVLSLLFLVHNLSLLMFILFLTVWIGYVGIKLKQYKSFPPLVLAGVFSFLLAAFYLLPVVFESRYIDLGSTTRGYFDFRAHYATISELLFSRFWGYGASLFGPEDGLGLSVGQVQWTLPLLVVLLLIFRRAKELKDVLILVLVGWIALFLTHNKSTVIWENLRFLAYLQFPWRWLSIATFSFALAGGAIVFLFRRGQSVISAAVIAMAILFNLSFFREDIWYQITDKEQFSGKRWEEQIASSLGDYWPVFAKSLPKSPAFTKLVVEEGKGEELYKNTNKAAYNLSLSRETLVQFPITYFPGWQLYLNNKLYSVAPSGELGLISANLPKMENQEVLLRFTDTPIRKAGNWISLATLAVVGGLIIKKKYEV